IRRLLLAIPTIIGATLIVFLLTRAGGTNMIISAYINPRIPYAEQKAALVAEFHLNQPLYIQYIYFMNGIIHGNWGYTRTAIFSGPVTAAIGIFFPNTIQLAIVAFIIAMVVGIPLGTIAAIRKDTWVDQVTRVLAFIGISLPIFWLAQLLQTYLGTPQGIKIFPLQGTVSSKYLSGIPWINSYGVSSPTHIMIFDALIHRNWPIFISAVDHVILPSITLAFFTLASIMRYMRNSTVEVLNQDYVKFARAKGIAESRVIKKYARRNALIPVITISGLTLASLLGGAVITETVYGYPGIGYWTVQAMESFDAGGILGATLLFSFTIIAANLVVDVIYAYVDPRIRLGD
ncbi:MAG: ABC transporter permease, partial [Nitrososphaerota archaeon]